jgi:1,2-diacylglycerol 3-alpha-glucosyltransferase
MLSQETKLKILITTDLYTVTTNGVVTSVQNLFDELTANGHDVRILTISGDLHSHKEGSVYYIRSVPLKGVYPDLRMPTSFRHKLIQEIIDWKPDVVHSQCEFFSYQFAARISKITGAPIVHTYHTLYEQYATYVVPSKRLGKKLVRFISRERLKKVHTVVAPTAKVEHTLHSYGLKNHISIVPSGIRLEQHKQWLSEEEKVLWHKINNAG